MMSIDGKVYSDVIRFPTGIYIKSEQERQELIEEHKYLAEEAIGKLYESLIENIEDIQDKNKYKLAARHNDKINKMIEWIEWIFGVWSGSLEVEKDV